MAGALAHQLGSASLLSDAMCVDRSRLHSRLLAEREARLHQWRDKTRHFIRVGTYSRGKSLTTRTNSSCSNDAYPNITNVVT